MCACHSRITAWGEPGGAAADRVKSAVVTMPMPMAMPSRRASAARRGSAVSRTSRVSSGAYAASNASLASDSEGDDLLRRHGGGEGKANA